MRADSYHCLHLESSADSSYPAVSSISRPSVREDREEGQREETEIRPDDDEEQGENSEAVDSVIVRYCSLDFLHFRLLH